MATHQQKYSRVEEQKDDPAPGVCTTRSSGEMPWKHQGGRTHYKLYKPTPDRQFKMDRQQSPDSGMKGSSLVDQKHSTDCDGDQLIDHGEEDDSDGLLGHIYTFAFFGCAFLVCYV